MQFLSDIMRNKECVNLRIHKAMLYTTYQTSACPYVDSQTESLLFGISLGIQLKKPPASFWKDIWLSVTYYFLIYLLIFCKNSWFICCKHFVCMFTKFQCDLRKKSWTTEKIRTNHRKKSCYRRTTIPTVKQVKLINFRTKTFHDSYLPLHK